MPYLYLHGFSHTPSSSQTKHFVSFFASHFHILLHAPNLYQPSFTLHSFTTMLQYLDQYDDKNNAKKEKWCIIGYSIGGYLAALWASLRPEKINK